MRTAHLVVSSSGEGELSELVLGAVLAGHWADVGVQTGARHVAVHQERREQQHLAGAGSDQRAQNNLQV